MEKNQNVNNEETELDINHLMQIRREKLRELQEQGKNPLQLDSKTPNFEGFKDYLLGENRFSQLLKVNPEHAEQLMAKCQADAQKRRARLEKMAQ